MNVSLPSLPDRPEKALATIGIALMIVAGSYGFHVYDKTMSDVMAVDSTFRVIDRELKFFREDSVRRWTSDASPEVTDALRERRRALVLRDDANQQKLQSIKSDLEETGRRVFWARVAAGVGLLLLVIGLGKWFRSPIPASNGVT